MLLSTCLAGVHTAVVGVDSPEAAARVVAIANQHAALARCWRPLCIVDFGALPPIHTLRGVPGVRYVERDRLLSPASPPPEIVGTTDCPDLWELETIGLAEAWDHVGGSGADAPVVAIQDTGFLLTHLDLGAVSGQFDYGDRDSVPEVSWASGVPGHGTFIAGLISARDGNDLGRVGVVPGASLNLQKIADSSGALYFSYAVAAMLDLADGDLGVRVLNYSIASASTTAGFDDAVAALGEADILLVAAAGNCPSADCWDADNDDYPLYPANSSGGHVLSVAGSTRSDGLNSYSHRGASTVDLAAPGVELCSLGVGSDSDAYVSAGTSYAAPLVAATAALVWEAWPRLRARDMARVLRVSSAPSAELDGLVRSGGVLSAVRAVQTAVPALTTPDIVTVDGRARLTLSIDNPAAVGEGVVVFIHGDRVVVEDASGGWAVASLDAGDSVDLPDAGTVTFTRAATVLRGPLAADASLNLDIAVVGRLLGEADATVRVAAVSVGADYLNAPYSTGVIDETGFLAETVRLVVQSVAQPEGDDTATPEDDNDPDGTDANDSKSGSADVAPGAEERAGCSCSTGTVPGKLWVLIALVGVVINRRQDA